MDVWTLSGCHLTFRLPATIIDPVLSYVDRYMVLTREDTGAAIDVVRSDVRRHEKDVEIDYELPRQLFDCRQRAVSANCLLVEDGIARFELAAKDRSGALLKPHNGSQRLSGSVDYFDGERIRGWAMADKGEAKTVDLGLFIDNQLIQKFPAADLRRDVQRKQGGNGLCGFQATLPSYVFDGRVRMLCVAPLSTLRPLRNGHLRVDLPSIEATVVSLIRNRIERLEGLLD